MLAAPFLLLFYWAGNFFRNVENIDNFALVDIASNFMGSLDVWIYIFKSSLNRFMGLDGIMYYLQYDKSINLVQALNFTSFFTYDVVGVQNANDFRSPGIFSFLLFCSPGILVFFYPLTLFIFIFIFLFFVKNYFNKFIGYKLFVLYSLHGIFSEGYLKFEDIFSLLIGFFIVQLLNGIISKKNYAIFSVLKN
jgi:hypothetical protein